MSQKRKQSEALDDAGSNPKTFKKHRAFKPGGHNQKPRFQKRPNQSNDDDNARSTNTLKSRIRDLKRLLAHVDNVPKHKMSASARQDRERELEAAEHELAEKLNASREADYKKKMISKYHQVRFFDRQKATRILKRLTKELASAEDDAQKTQLKQRIHNTEVDVNYAIYYPLMKPYSSLYPKSKKHKDGDEGNDSDDKTKEADGPKGDVEMWRAVEKAMEEGTLETLRYSKDAIPAAPPQKKNKIAKAKEQKKDVAGRKEKASVSKQKDTVEEEDVEESDEDGGFFDE